MKRHRTAEDRRVRRTKNQLHRALASLLHEKSWDDIVVKEILGRADVGRSTFYTHYRDKDELLQSALRETVAANATTRTMRANATERVLGFSLPLLEHVARIRDAHPIASSAERYTSLHARLEPALVDLIREELRLVAPAPSPARSLPVELVARQIVSTFILTLEWWVGLSEQMPARSANDLFCSLARPTVDAFLG